MKEIAGKAGRIDLHRAVMRVLPDPVSRFCLAGLAGAGVILLASAPLLGLGAPGQSAAIAAAAMAGAVAFAAVGMRQAHPHRKLGLANLVTLARLVIIGVICVAFLEAKTADRAVLALAILSLALDGIDGWLARRQTLASPFGARFDVEVDAFFALLLAGYAARTGAAEPYVILLGLPHYAFWVARRLMPWLGAPLPPSLARKAVCVAQIGVLIALLVPGLPGTFVNAMVIVVIAALAWSFGRDILWLHRQRG